MTKKIFGFSMETLAVSILLISLSGLVRSDELIPADISQVQAWYNRQVGASGPRTSSVAPPLAAAEAKSSVITVKAGGGGNFKTVTEAVNSIPAGNTNRVIIHIGPGNYTERIRVDRSKKFVTLYGDPNNNPVLISTGTAAEHGTVDSATLITEGDFFSAVNIKVVNAAPRPDGVRQKAMAAALRVSGDGSSFYNCKFYGYQDTLCDDAGQHFFKDCYIEGTVDFIFGSGKSIYLNSELHVIGGDNMAIIAAQARKGGSDPDGYVFVHCKITGSGGTAYLARTWFPYGRVIFAYTQMSDAVQPAGWFDNDKPNTHGTVYFAEYKNTGPGADLAKRVPYSKKLTDAEAQQFLSLAFVGGSTWLLPPAKV